MKMNEKFVWLGAMRRSVKIKNIVPPLYTLFYISILITNRTDLINLQIFNYFLHFSAFITLLITSLTYHFYKVSRTNKEKLIKKFQKQYYDLLNIFWPSAASHHPWGLWTALAMVHHQVKFVVFLPIKIEFLIRLLNNKL